VSYPNPTPAANFLNPLVTPLLQITYDFASADHKATLVLSEIHARLHWWPPSTVQTVLWNISPIYLPTQWLGLSVHI